MQQLAKTASCYIPATCCRCGKPWAVQQVSSNACELVQHGRGHVTLFPAHNGPQRRGGVSTPSLGDMEQGAQLGRGLCPQQRPLRWHRRAVWMEEVPVWSGDLTTGSLCHTSLQLAVGVRVLLIEQQCLWSRRAQVGSGSGPAPLLLVAVGQWLLSQFFSIRQPHQADSQAQEAYMGLRTGAGARRLPRSLRVRARACSPFYSNTLAPSQRISHGHVSQRPTRC